MRILRKFLFALRRFVHWYQYPIEGHRLIRVDPFTVLALIGLATTAWGVGKGLGAQASAENIAAALRGAPAMLNSRVSQSHSAGNMSGYDREVALRRVDELSPIFNQFADLIEARGNDIAVDAMAQGMTECLFALGPGEQAGKLVGGLATGKGIDRLIGILFIKKSIEEFELFSTPFAGEEAALRQRIVEILGKDADSLFKARMRTKINFLKREWEDMLKKYDNDADKADEEYRAWVLNRARVWAENPRLYGPGEKWATYEDFIDWLIRQARGEGGTLVQMTLEGTHSGGIGPTVPCFACIPPSASGSIKLVVDYASKSVSGEVSGNGSGSSTADICDENDKPTGEKHTASGDLTFTGTITGSFDPESGEINAKSTIQITSTQEGGPWPLDATITGVVKKEGSGSGKFTFASDACAFSGEWTAQATAKGYDKDGDGKPDD
jgi:hypothetical protein